MGKGPMSQGNNLRTRDEASPPQPTRAGRIELCQGLIEEARRCLDDKALATITDYDTRDSSE
ncbi:MAG: hypothetical protein AT717_00820 [Vulcanisaeta sp. CIS_19]|nr:MAG: hypothetical protein AT717_00820 [Vulcanisaeta sp. CIS_19]